jgi:hypothetical protein
MNTRLLERQPYLAMYSLMLTRQQLALEREIYYQDEARWHRMRVAWEMPYPLSLEAAREHYVMPWSLVDESDELTRWVADRFLEAGRTELPEHAYRLQDDYGGSFNPPEVDAVRECFPDAESYQRFVAGEDFSYGLADVTDEEFVQRYETLESAMRELGLGGQVVEFPTVPHGFLRDAPLLEGKWIDRYVVALAEWGARLEQRGYRIEESDDPHPLAWWRVSDAAREEPGSDVTGKLWQQAQRSLQRFPGAHPGD